jgi:lipoate-protein ligase A
MPSSQEGVSLTSNASKDNSCAVKPDLSFVHQLTQFDVSFDKPNMNLAFDEALLDACEDGSGDECLRFWESPVPFVVLGVSQVKKDEANLDACEHDSVPVLRRCSAGGAVLQGPGCLNYSIVLRYEDHPATESLRGSYCAILGALSESFEASGIPLRIRGTSDLALGDRKVSGSAQKRRRRAFLHHGTFLYAMQDADIARYLREPTLRPEYRGARTHATFVTNLPMQADAIRIAVRRAFHASGLVSPPGESQLKHAMELQRTKYDSKAWIDRR